MSEEHRLCEACHAMLLPPPTDHCLRCGGDTAGAPNGCGHCLGNRLAPDAVYCGYVYAGLITELVVGFKFHDRTHWAPLLADLLWQRQGDVLHWESPDLVMPVPLHPWKQIRRRYNQTALLGREIAQRLHRPLETNGVKRVKMGYAQSRLGRAERLLNLTGAFVADPGIVAERAILVVDDVLTTGATLAALSASLKQAGAKRVAAVCLARTPNDSLANRMVIR